MAKPKKRATPLKLGLLSAVAAMGVMAFGASAANADPVTQTFTDGSLKVAGTESGTDVLGAPADPATTLTFDAVFPGEGVTTGAFQVSPATFNYQQTPIDISGVEGALDLVPVDPLDPTPMDGPFGTFTGDYNESTGVMTAALDGYWAVVFVSGAPCRVGPLSLDFSTEDDSIYLSDPFDADSNPALNGSMTSTWATLPTPSPAVPEGAPDPDTYEDIVLACQILSAFTNGPGGLWLANGTSTPTLTNPPAPPAPPANPQTPTTKKKCKKGQKLKKGKCVKKKKKKKKK